MISRRPLLKGMACMAAGVGTAVRAASGKGSLRIATALDCSGIGRINGLDLVAGTKALVQRVNQEGGVHGMPLELLVEDDRFDPRVTREKTAAFVAQPNVVALLHPLGTVQTAAMISAAGDCPLVGPSTGSIDLRKLRTDIVFWTRASFAQEMDRLLLHAKTLAMRTAALVYPDDALGKSLLAVFKAGCEKHGIEAVKTASTPNVESMEVQPAAKALAEVHPDFLVVGLAGSAAAFVNAYRALTRTSMLYGLAIGASAGSLKAMGDNARGVGFSMIVPSPNTEKFELVRNYRRDLKAAGSEQYSLYGVEGYMSASVLVQALRRAANPTSRASVVAALEELSALDLGGVRIAFGKGDHDGGSYVGVAVAGADARLTM